MGKGGSIKHLPFANILFITKLFNRMPHARAHTPSGLFCVEGRFPGRKKPENYAVSHGSIVTVSVPSRPTRKKEKRRKEPSRRKSPRDRGGKGSEERGGGNGKRPSLSLSLDHRHRHRCPASKSRQPRRPLDAGRGVQREAAADSAVRRRSQWQQLPVPSRHRPGMTSSASRLQSNVIGERERQILGRMLGTVKLK